MDSMDAAERGATVQGYIRHNEWLGRAGPEEDAPPLDENAYFAFREAIWDGPAGVAWELVTALLRAVPDERLETYAAGPLEDLVRLRAPELIDEIEREAQRDARFRWALGCIWMSHGEMPDDILDRVVRASGGEIKPLPPLKELEALEASLLRPDDAPPA
jgi:hypothetical protein